MLTRIVVRILTEIFQFIFSRHAQGARHRDSSQQKVSDLVGHSARQNDPQD
jgi:hypothetical protein